MRIVSCRHKGLKKFLTGGDPKGIRPEDRERLIEILVELLILPQPLLTASLRVHQLLERCGSEARKYAVRVSNSWRLTFRRDSENNIIDLDYVQYH